MRGSEARDPVQLEPTQAHFEQSFPPNVVPLRPRRIPDTPAGPVDPAQPAAPPAIEPAAVTSPVSKPGVGSSPIHLPEWPLVLILSSMVLGIAVVLLDSFRRGALVMAGALVMSFFLRLVLSDREAGMLKVRRRSVDLAVLAVFAIALLVLGLWVPAPS